MMSKHFEKSKLVNKLPKDDPECVYVNSMMEMTTELLRNICSKSGENFDKMHGIVPTCKLPSGYDFGKNQHLSTKQCVYDQRENKNLATNSQNSSNSNSTLRMEVDDLNPVDEKTNKMIETVSEDIRLSGDEEEEDHETDRDHVDNADEITDNMKGDSEKIFETLNKCSGKIPRVSSLNLFRKHYGNNKSDSNLNDSNKNSKKDPPDNESCTGDTEPFEDSNESAKAKPQDVMKFIELLSSSKPEIKLSTFEPIYNEINRKRQRLKVKEDEEMVSQPKKARFMVERVENSMELRMNIIPELAKDFNLKAAAEAMKKRQLLKEPKSSVSTVKPSYASQESLPFTKSENPIKKENKVIEKCSTSSNTQQLFSNTPSGNDPNAIKKPQAAAKQIFPHSTYNNNTKVAVVTGKINKAPSSLHNSNSNQQIAFHSNQKQLQSSKQLSIKDSNLGINNGNENEADELKIVEGIKAIDKLRMTVRNDFINRMRALDTEKWLQEADGHKENANRFRGKLEYPPMIILAVRKYLIYNYSLDVKDQSKKCHTTYLQNSEFVSHICTNLAQIYKDHINKILDPNSQRLWYLKLIKCFTVTMCLKLRAILQYRAYRNVASYCRELNTLLRQNGILDNDDRTNALVTENTQSISPFSVLSPYSPGRNSTRNSSPHVATPVNQRSIVNPSGISSTVTLTMEMKSHLQKYIEKTSIINNSYNDWMAAEKNHAHFCGRSARHEDAWKEIEWKIIEKTGGININSIDESMPFVITYLEGFINYMNEFQKLLHPPRSSDSRLIS